MNLDQTFRSAAAGLIYVFQGLHYWHRILQSSSLVLRPLFEMKVSLNNQAATEMGRSSIPISFYLSSVSSSDYAITTQKSRQVVALTARSHYMRLRLTRSQLRNIQIA